MLPDFILLQSFSNSEMVEYFTRKIVHLALNWKNSYFQFKAKCTIFLVKYLCFICTKIIFKSIALHLASLWSRSLSQLKNGQLIIKDLESVLAQMFPFHNKPAGSFKNLE